MYANRNARIVNKILGSVVQTETVGRDSGINVSVVKTSNGRTKLKVTTEDGVVVPFNGRAARTLFRALARHYNETGQSFEPVPSYT